MIILADDFSETVCNAEHRLSGGKCVRNHQIPPVAHQMSTLNFFGLRILSHPITPLPPSPTHIIRPSHGELRKCFGLQIWSHQIPLLSTRIGLSHGELPETSQSRLCLVTVTIAIIERDHLLDDYFSRFSFISTSTQVPMSLACNT